MTKNIKIKKTSNIKLSETKLYKKIISEDNLYAAIFSLESYILNKELLADDDLKLYYKLRDKFNFELIEEIMEKVKVKIDTVVLYDDLFEVSAYFRIKKLKKEDTDTEESIISRPIHTSDLITQIAIVSILNGIMYEYSNGKREPGDLVSILPSNFYGNIPSNDIEKLFIPWKQMYKKYSNDITNCYSRFINTKEYNYEVSLDLINFFPSINPIIIYNFIIDKLSIKYRDDELICFKVLLSKILYFKVINISKNSSEYYQYNYLERIGLSTYYSQGIVQGLPQSYFFGNICMIKISEIFESVFEGRSFYYVDDSVIFINSEDNLEDNFDTLLNKINGLLENFCTESEDYSQIVINKWTNDIKKFSLKNKYRIRIHDKKGKSKITKIDSEKEGENYLKYLSKEASLGAFELRATFSDIEDITLKNKFSELVSSINLELERIEKSKEIEGYENYRKLLFRLKKFFKFRKQLLEYKENNYINEKYIKEKIKLLTIANKTEQDIIVLDKLKLFLKSYDEDIFLVEFLFILENIKDEDTYLRLKKATNTFDKLVYGDFYSEVSYFSKIVSALDIKNKYDYIRVDNYSYLSNKANYLINDFSNVHYNKKMEIVQNIHKNFLETEGKDELNLFYNYINEKKYLKLVLNSTDEAYRVILNTIISKVFNVVLSDKFQISKLDNKPLTHSEFRILVFLRNRKFIVDDFYYFKSDINLKKDDGVIDYSILEVVDYYIAYAQEPLLVDNLIQIHKYTCDIWKNGSKHLHFYTLHNQEHAVELIKASIKCIKSMDYFQISKKDYYVLFISCYLHDISMVVHPDMKSIFNSDYEEANLIYAEFKRKFVEFKKNIDFISSKKVKDMLINYYIKIDSFFERHVRKNHTKESAKFIRTSDDLSFIEDSIREIVAEVSESHGYDVRDIYDTKSEVERSVFSKKYLKIVLRMADLLDMSKNRITKAILNNNMEYMSNDTQFHWLSHQTITGYDIKTEYSNIIDNNHNAKRSYISKGAIVEKLILIIYVNNKYMIKMKSLNCKKVRLSDECYNPEFLSITINEIEEKECKCPSNSCNFMCKWMAIKNYYLYEELFALQKYLNRTDNNYFKTEMEVRIKFTDKDALSSNQLDLIEKYISGNK